MEKHKHDNIRRYGLLGKNIAYSFSRGYFANKFKKEKIELCQYENFDIEAIDDVKKLFVDTSIVGMNVTIPYKEAILPYLYDVRGDAAAIGAVNTIAFDSNRNPIGYNTDAYGFETTLKSRLHKNPKKALILGTGGAAKAIAYVLQKNNIEAQFVSRKATDHHLSYEQVNTETIVAHPLIINCSPLGTHPDIHEKPNIPYHALTSDHLLYDLIYNPEKTSFLLHGEQYGANIQNGYSMLVHQAEKSWAIWRQRQ